MKILIDECLPKKLKQSLIGHAVKTVPEMGWAGKKNGELLRLMTGVFDIFITIDSQMQFQQQLIQHPISYIVLSAPNNKFGTLLQLMPEVSRVLETIQIGQIVKVEKKTQPIDE